MKRHRARGHTVRCRTVRCCDCGVTLLELVLAGGLSLIVATMAGSWLLITNRTFVDTVAQQDAEIDLRIGLDLLMGELYDARPPARCDDDPAPVGDETCMTWVDDWDRGPIDVHTGARLCFFALPTAGAPIDPNSDQPPRLEHRCVGRQQDRLEVTVRPVSYDAQLATTIVDMPTTRVLARGLALDDGLQFVYGLVDLSSDPWQIATVTVVLRHRGADRLHAAAGPEVRGTVMFRANRFSPCRTPLAVTTTTLTPPETTVTTTVPPTSTTTPTTTAPPSTTTAPPTLSFALYSDCPEAGS